MPLHDPMHVHLEGTAKTKLQRILKIFICDRKYFSGTFRMNDGVTVMATGKNARIYVVQDRNSNTASHQN